jgi:hypothetical protein
MLPVTTHSIAAMIASKAIPPAGSRLYAAGSTVCVKTIPFGVSAFRGNPHPILSSVGASKSIDDAAKQLSSPVLGPSEKLSLNSK